MSVIGSNILAGASGQQGYNISRSVRLRSSATAFFSRTPASAGSRTTWTMSFWIKLGNTAGGSIFGGASSSNNPRMQFYYTSSTGVIEWYQSDSGGGTVFYLIPTQVFRDSSAWYHFVVVADTTQATSSNRLKWYVNGVQITSFNTGTYPSQNTNTEWNTNTIHNIGRQPNASAYFDGYLTEVNFIDGQALTPSSFGETNTTTGVWQPKKYTGTYGTNGFYLNFSDNSAATAAAIGADYSGNGNNWTPNNISVTAGVTYDSMLDVPTQWADGGNGRGNYCTLNPLDSGRTLSQGNLFYAGGGATIVKGTIGVSSGKWYWEFTPDDTECIVGIVTTTTPSTASYVGSTSGGYGWYRAGSKYNNGASSAYGSSWTTGDIIGVAFDADAGTLTYYKNNTSQGVAFSGLTGNTYCPANGNNSADDNGFLNFGQRPFTYTPPTGFVALNTLNLPTPTILKGNQYFDATTYTGNGGTLSVTNSGGMQPDFVWYKSRSVARDHGLFDSVRGVTAYLGSNLTNAEQTVSGVTAFNSNGFTLGSAVGGNNSAESYIGWQWRAGVSAVTNTAGSITSTVDAGTTQGFSIVTYTGTGANATVGHGLGVAPSMIIVKNRTTSGTSWNVYHISTGNTGAMFLETTNAFAADSTRWNNTSPTSTVFTIGNGAGVNQNTNNLVAYCFAPVAGFSAFGSYTGNGSTNGAFIYLGFRPEFVLVKQTNAVGNWIIWDTARSTYNQMQDYLSPNNANAESNNVLVSIDALSNGFKCRTADDDINGNGDTYIYMAFAENPFKNSLAR